MKASPGTDPAVGTLTLTPPLPELPPPLWRDPVVWGTGFAAILGIALLVTAILLIRARLSRPPTPETLAQAALDRDGSPLGVTRAARQYLAARFPGMHVAMTTQELEKHAGALPVPGWPELLRACDEAKFAGVTPTDDLRQRAKALVAATGDALAKAAKRR